MPLGLSLSAKIGWYTGPREPNGCRVWTGYFDRTGYAIIQHGGARRRVTRTILGLGSRNSTVAMHSCDRPGCVEPSHLRAGTYAENSADMISKGRARGHAGSTNYFARLSESDIPKIREMYEGGMLQKEIAAAVGVSKSLISLILLGRIWKHVSPERRPGAS